MRKGSREMKQFFVAIIAGIFPLSAMADSVELVTAIENVRNACGGISNELSGMKKLAGINTAVTGVGTVVGGVALGTGIAKANVDNEIEEWERILSELEAEQEKAEIVFTVINPDDVNKALKDMKLSKIDVGGHLDELNEQSKTLGNIRTGTMAAAGATNIAGTIIAANNRVRGDLQSQIDNCIAATKVLANVKMQARMDGDANPADLERADKIVSACQRWEMVDLSKIDNRAVGAMVSSAVGATTGIAGTITSATVNSDATRNDNTDSGKQREKNLNTASNVLAGTTTVASGAATVFNATQISAIKRASETADECEGVLN